MLLAISVNAQNCLQTTISLQSSISSDGPDYLYYTLLDSEMQEITFGEAAFDDDVSSQPFIECLDPGCYTLIADAVNDIPPFSAFVMVNVDGGYPNEYDLVIEGTVITVEFCIIENSECDLVVNEIENDDCSLIEFVAESSNPAAQIEWSVNGTSYQTGPSIQFEATEAGPYEICAQYETPDCPEGVSFCEVVEVSQDCIEEEDCPLDFEVVVNGCEAVLYLSGSTDGAVFYYVNGELVSNGELVFTYELPYNMSGVGVNYTFCAVYDGICDQTEFCESMVVSSCVDCGIEINYTEESCGEFTFTADVASGWQDVLWYLDGVLIGEDVWQQEISLGEGLHEVCVGFETPNCEYTEACVTVMGCAEDSCDLDYSIDMTACGEYTVSINQAPSDAQVFVLFLGQLIPVENNAAVIIPDITDLFEVCVLFETPDCPDGVFECEMIELQSCECPDGLIIEQDACSAVFMVSGNAPVFNADYYVNGELVNNGEWQFSYTFPEDGTYTVCVVPAAPCEFIEFCEEIEVTGCPQCTPVFIEVTSDLGGVPASMVIETLLLTTTIESEDDVEFEAMQGSTGISTCLFDGCFECSIGLIGMPYEGMEVEVTVGDEVVYSYTVQTASPPEEFTLPVNVECETSVIELFEESRLSVYPNPADQQIFIESTASGLMNVDLLDLTGRMVYAEQVNFSERMSLDVSGLSNGFYILRLWDENGSLQEKIQVRR